MIIVADEKEAYCAYTGGWAQTSEHLASQLVPLFLASSSLLLNPYKGNPISLGSPLVEVLSGSFCVLREPGSVGSSFLRCNIPISGDMVQGLPGCRKRRLA